MSRLSSRYSKLLFLITIILLSGCYSSARTTTFRELENVSIHKKPIRVLTTDSTLYTFNTFSFTEKTLTGKGTSKKNGKTKNFEGTLKFSNIIFIERIKRNYWKAFWIIPMAAAIVSGISTLSDKPKFEIRRPFEGSCPFVYSFDGSKFILEAESFSTSISGALESETYHVLPSLAPVRNKLRVRISNKRPETHLVNSVHLYAVDAPKTSRVVLDNKNNAWTVLHAMTPVSALDNSGDDILDSVMKKDGNYWKSDLKKASAHSRFRDTLTVQFEIPEGKSEATLIVDAINTSLITETYHFVSAVLGDESLEFYRAMEQDPDMKKLAREGILKSSLLIEEKNDHGWKKVGTLLPEADAVPFTRAIRLKHLDHYRNPLTLRFSSMTDVWHIDALSMDYSQGVPLVMHSLEITSVSISNTENNPERLIAKNDSLYAILLPPEHMDLIFDSTPTKDIQNPVYVLSAKGYLYEWLPDDRDISLPGIPSQAAGIDRIELMKFLIRHLELSLPAIYARWEKENR